MFSSILIQLPVPLSLATANSPIATLLNLRNLNNPHHPFEHSPPQEILQEIVERNSKQNLHGHIIILRVRAQFHLFLDIADPTLDLHLGLVVGQV